MNEPLTPYDDTKDKFWQHEEWDNYLPSKGFLTDFVLAGRGVETPTIFALWSGIYAISTALKRDTYIQWGGSREFANFFIFLIADPRICAKSYMMNKFAIPVLKKFRDYLEDPVLHRQKEINFILGKATEEGLFKAMKPSKVPVFEGTKATTIDLGSTVAIAISELTTFINKKEYTRGLIEKLTDLYDCRKEDAQITQSRGNEPLRNIFVTLIGGTTPDAVKTTIPISAFGDGFISRVIPLYGLPTRCYSEPRVVANAPGIPELAERLAIIAEKAQGGYRFSPEASVYWGRWYNKNREKIIKDPEYGKKYARIDVQLLKLALILRVQRYDFTDKYIHVQDLREAEVIIKKSLETSFGLLEEAQVEERSKDYVRIRNFIQKYGKLSRRKLLTTFSSRGISSDKLSFLLRTLLEEGRITVKRFNRVQKVLEDTDRISTIGKEEYTWVGIRLS